MTLGIVNKNPGNIRFSPNINWLGQIGESHGFAVFDTPENGIRALARILLNYQAHDNCNTVTKIITRWAPPSDDNPTNDYIANVATRMGVSATQNVVLSQNTDLLVDMIKAIITQENGDQPYSDDLVRSAISDAEA